jgi:HK97 family phage major capsid protein
MNKNKIQIQSDLAAIRSKIEELVPFVENGTANDEQVTELRNKTDEAYKLQESLDVIEKASNIILRGKATGVKKETPEDKLAKRFSITETIRGIKNGKHKMEGAMAEVHQEAINEARNAQVSLQGFGLPSFITQRAAGVDATVPATAADLIETSLGSFTDALRPRLMMEQLGVTVLGNLRGNVTLPAGDAITTASFYTEQAEASASDPSVKTVTLSPKRLATWSSSTLQLEAQASVDVDNWLLRNILYAEANKVESTAILGGGANEFDGILSLTGTNEIELGPDGNTGANVTRANLLAMETEVEDANADVERMGFLTTNGMKAFLKNLAENGDGSQFVWRENNEVLGYQAMRSSLVPTNLVKGTSNAIHHAIIFGSFRNYIIGNWGVRDLVVDEVSMKKFGITEVIMNSFWDGVCVHPKHFSVIKTATV